MLRNESSKLSMSTSILLKPELSQIAIITLLLISGVSFFISFYFSWHEKNWTLPVLVALLSLGLASLGWWKSQRTIDMANSSPTEIVAPDGSRVVTDTRAIESPNTTKQLATLIETIAVRHPLPKASGIVDDKGNVVPNSETKGNQVVDSINEKITTLVASVEESFIRQQEEKASILQDLPIDDDIEKHSGTTKGDA